MKILIVEDDKGIAEILREGLTAESHTVEVADNGADGSFLARSFDYDAIVLDYSLPKKNGLIVCKEVRDAGKHTPILFLSSTETTATKIDAFNSGADDYVTKPFSISEFNARVRAVMRRGDTRSTSILQVRDLIMDTDAYSVTRGKKEIKLTRKEYSLLEFFLRNPGKVLSRAVIMEHVWAADQDPFSNTVEAHIRNVRKKINAGYRPSLIINIPGRGYVLDRPDVGEGQRGKK
jgi:two-component system, OmpR family, copper resistance phosphate regulon response regulator CusR